MRQQWTAKKERLSESEFRFVLSDIEGALTHEKVHQLWATDPEFARFYSDSILSAGFECFCWETPAVSKRNLSEPHEFVIADSPLLGQMGTNSSPFREHFEAAKPGELVLSFPNLGRNGTMIVPVPSEDGISDFGNFGKFLTTASPKQIQALWRTASESIREEIGSDPKWISTAGMGVAWLHLRIDQRPKYYRHQPYKEV